jgi:hypothetical protein
LSLPLGPEARSPKPGAAVAVAEASNPCPAVTTQAASGRRPQASEARDKRQKRRLRAAGPRLQRRETNDRRGGFGPQASGFRDERQTTEEAASGFRPRASEARDKRQKKRLRAAGPRLQRRETNDRRGGFGPQASGFRDERPGREAGGVDYDRCRRGMAARASKASMSSSAVAADRAPALQPLPLSSPTVSFGMQLPST